MRTTPVITMSLLVALSGCNESPTRWRDKKAEIKAYEEAALKVEQEQARLNNQGQGAWADTLHKKAGELALQGELDLSTNLLDESIDVAPDNAELYVTYGTILRKQGDYSQAIKHLSRAIRLDPNFSHAYCQRAFAYQQSQLDPQGDKAYADASHAIKLKPSSLAFIIRGNVFRDREQIERAINDYGRAIEIEPSSYSAFGNRAIAFAMLGNIAMATEDIETALSLNAPAQEIERLELIMEYLRRQNEELPGK